MKRLLVLLLFAACNDTGQEFVTYPIVAAGVSPGPFAAGDWQVTLTRAQVGLGPLYFCATSGASASLCPVALAELTDTVTVDALATTAQPLGDVHGVTGPIRSMTFDYAITWLTTETSAKPKSGAPGGHSARFEGTATKGSETVHFVADVDVVPRYQGSRAVEGARVMADVVDDHVEVDVVVDPRDWWKNVDFDALAAQGGDPVVVAPGSRAYNAVVVAMTANYRPSFTWRNP
jgi:hypothetical protein